MKAEEATEVPVPDYDPIVSRCNVDLVLKC